MINSITLVIVAALAAPGQEAACNGLTDLALPGATVTAAELVAAGPYTVQQRREEFTGDLPAHCRVALVLTPSFDSHIEMELWLPLGKWNGKFLAVGNVDGPAPSLIARWFPG